MAVTVWTIGHSTHPIEEFLRLLRGQRIRVLVDIRRFPTSRWPQFKQDALKASLAATSIEYVHLAELGGYRKGGYEGHARTPEFASGLARLVSLAEPRRTVIMCAEAVFFRCHRRYVSEALVKAGHEVLHVYPDGRVRPHELRGTLDAYS